MKNLKKTILALILVGTFLVSSVPAQAATVVTDAFSPELTPTFNPASVLRNPTSILRSSVNIAETHTWNFTGRSVPKFICPQMDADTISLTATCEGDQVDTIIFILQGADDDNSTFRKEIPFQADGNVYTFGHSIPPGIYKGNFQGDSNINKSYAQAIFTVLKN